MDPNDLVPSVGYPPSSSFGKRLASQRAAKQHVAVKIDKDFGLAPGISALVLDGSSSFYVALAIMHRTIRATTGESEIMTVSEAVGDEFAFAENDYRVRIRLAEGDVDKALFTVHGESADRFVERHAADCQYTIVSVNALFAHQGPYGVDAVTLRMKRRVMRSDCHFSQLIVVTDHTKFVRRADRDSESSGNKVFPVLDAWQKLKADPRFFVFTTRYPNAPDAISVKAPIDLPTDQVAQWPEPKQYAFQSGHLQREMGDRFIEFPFCNARPCTCAWRTG